MLLDPLYHRLAASVGTHAACRHAPADRPPQPHARFHPSSFPLPLPTLSNLSHPRPQEEPQPQGCRRQQASLVGSSARNRRVTHSAHGRAGALARTTDQPELFRLDAPDLTGWSRGAGLLHVRGASQHLDPASGHCVVSQLEASEQLARPDTGPERPRAAPGRHTS